MRPASPTLQTSCALITLLIVPLASAAVSAPMPPAASTAREPEPVLSSVRLALVESGRATTSSDASFRMYDLRDLAVLLPPEVPEPTEPVTGDLPMIRLMSVARAAGQSSPVKTPIQHLVGQVTSALGLSATEISTGIYLIRAEDAIHTQLGDIFGRVRALYSDVVDVEIAVFHVTADKAPALGSAANVDATATRIRQTVSRRAPTRFAAMRSTCFVSDWQPVVGTQAVGYDPETRWLDDGLDATIIVAGAGADTGPIAPKAGDTTHLIVRGSLTSIDPRSTTFGHVDLDQTTGGVTGKAGAALVIVTPIVQQRSIDADIGIPAGKPTVISVVPGFEEGQVIVIAATITDRH